jgi:hypothetical protein
MRTARPMPPTGAGRLPPVAIATAVIVARGGTGGPSGATPSGASPSAASPGARRTGSAAPSVGEDLAWEKTFTKRQVWIDEVAFEDGKPVVKGPDVGPQPKP